LLHIFSLDTSSLELARAFKRERKRVVISSVFNSFGVSYVRKRIETILPRLVPGFLSGIRAMSELIDLADAVVVLNEEECALLAEYFPSVTGKTVEIPNGFSEDVGPEVAEIPRPRHVLNVAEITPRKNQLNLIEAARGADWKLTIVGKIPQNEYGKQCVELAGRCQNINMIGELAYRSPELVAQYASAKVFCLPSISEVQSLSLIEAAKYGCELAVSETVPVDKRVRAFTPRFNPARPVEIRKAVDAALLLSSGNARRMMDYPSWGQVAEMLTTEYKRLLAR